MDLLGYHKTIRKFFALLQDKSLAGLTQFQALMDLFERVKLYMPPDCNPGETMAKFMLHDRLQNVANDPGAAAGLLAWSEDEGVRPQEGWRESFTALERTDRYSTAQNIEISARIQEAEHRLSTFNSDDLWGLGISVGLSNGRKSYDRLHQALKTHFETLHRYWPLREPLEAGTLYDAYVDRSKEGLGFASGSQCNRNWAVNSNDPVSGGHQIDLAKVLATWDHKRKYAHLSKSLPLLPRSLTADEKAKQAKSGLFGSKSKALETHAAQAYEEDGNIEARIGLVPNPPVERFRQLETRIIRATWILLRHAKGKECSSTV